jgi:hypothetical protein
VLSLQANAHNLAGDNRRALGLIEEAIAAVGLDEEGVTAMIWIFKGDILSSAAEPDLGAAEDAYRRAIGIAAGVGARTIELEGLNRLVAMHRAGADELAPVYERFTEGHDELALVTARSLLDIS